jgi:hypothetical protein
MLYHISDRNASALKEALFREELFIWGKAGRHKLQNVKASSGIHSMEHINIANIQ